MPNKHPAGLTVLFLTEVWERFGFYVVQGLLVLYMTHRFEFTDGKSYSILGAFTALAYIAPVVGGYIADKMLGFRAAIIFGGILLCIGYGALAFLGANTFYFALAIIVVGTGLFKPNVSSLVGTLYEMDAQHRDAGFTIFYMGINLGIIFSTIISGFIQADAGWGVSFALASIGMIIAVITFNRGNKKLAGHGEFFIPPESIFNKKKVRYLVLALMLFAMLTFSTVLMICSQFADGVFSLMTILLFAGLFWLVVKQNKTQRNDLILLSALTLASVFFWALYFQLFFSLTLFIDRDVDRYLLGIHVPTVAFLSLISIFIVVFGPLVAKMWTTLKLRNCDFSLPVKFACGLIFAGLGFLVMVIGTHFPNAEGLISPLWLILGYFLMAMGELFLSPIGLSMVTQLAPAHLVGALMGVWFFSLGVGGQLAGVIAEWAAIPKDVTDVATQITLYRHAFLVYAVIGVVLGVLILLINSGINRLCSTKKA